MNSSEITRDGKAIAVIKHYGTNSVVGLLANHYQKCRKFNQTAQKTQAMFPEELTIYAATSQVSANDLKSDVQTAYDMFGVDITVNDLSQYQNNSESTGTNGLIFIQ